MMLNYLGNGKVEINMKDYIKKILSDLDERFNGTAVIPAANYLFEVNKSAEKLS